MSARQTLEAQQGIRPIANPRNDLDTWVRREGRRPATGEDLPYLGVDATDDTDFAGLVAQHNQNVDVPEVTRDISQATLKRVRVPAVDVIRAAGTLSVGSSWVASSIAAPIAPPASPSLAPQSSAAAPQANPESSSGCDGSAVAVAESRGGLVASADDDTQWILDGIIDGLDKPTNSQKQSAIL